MLRVEIWVEPASSVGSIAQFDRCRRQIRRGEIGKQCELSRRRVGGAECRTPLHKIAVAAVISIGKEFVLDIEGVTINSGTRAKGQRRRGVPSREREQADADGLLILFELSISGQDTVEDRVIAETIDVIVIQSFVAEFLATIRLRLEFNAGRRLPVGVPSSISHDSQARRCSIEIDDASWNGIGQRSSHDVTCDLQAAIGRCRSCEAKAQLGVANLLGGTLLTYEEPRS